MSTSLRCPKCGCRLDEPSQGRHSGKWFVKHTTLSRCNYDGKHWGFHDSEEAAVSAVLADESLWQPVDQKTLAFVNRLIETEIAKREREQRKGYMAQ